MKPTLNEKFIAYLALISGLSISAVAVYYSVIGLTAIFAAAAIPIIIMGVVLEVSKLVATVWLKQNWETSPKLIRSYLVAAVAVLMFITSMGIFGFLSKAHLDQSVPTGDVADKVALIDEKIKTQRENIDVARKALKQMDESVDQILARSNDERGAERAAQLRRQQARERSVLQQEIANAQRSIATLNDERGPIAKDLRKVEAEVGPIKYIAAFFYGDTDQTVLEKAVTWVIIIIVIVFDPLAVVLLLAAQTSFQQFRIRENQVTEEEPLPEPDPRPEPQPPKQVEQVYLKRPWVDKVPGIEPVGHQVYQPPKKEEPVEQAKYEPDDGPLTDDQIKQIEESVKENLEVKKPIPLKELSAERVSRMKVFPRVNRPPQESYVQNEEQQESNVWSATINSEEYHKLAQQRREKEILDYAEMVRSKRIQMEDVPEEYQTIVKSKV